jgi:hypothetical protein
MPPGRPRLVLDERQIEELASMQCTMEEIARVMGCHVDTLRDNYSNAVEMGRVRGKQSLRRLQWRCAETGGRDQGPNAAMCIWLGKQWLDQQDRTHVTWEKVSDEEFAREAERRMKLTKSA